MDGVSSLFDETLTHLHDGALRPMSVLRGSLLTSLWVPGRGVNDIDLLVDGTWTPQSLTPVLERAFLTLRAEARDFIVIWAETDNPGVRATVRRGAELVQVDFGWGERLAVPPIDTLVRGRTWRAVTPEVMFGWKVHSLVEHGPRGRWHAKTIADLYLMLRHVRLQKTLVRSCLDAAFASQGMPLSTLDGFLDDPTWGQSRGSRNKWKSYMKKSPWVTFTLAEAFPVVRDAVDDLLRNNSRG